MVAPVCGFLPSRAALLETDQEPNPTRDTRPPPLRVFTNLEPLPKDQSESPINTGFC